MCETEIVMAFMAHLETHPMSNDFKKCWSERWKTITQRCLNVAKHQFVLQKAFELFKSGAACTTSSNWSELFVCKDEEKILISLCRYVKLQEEQFMDYGLNHHRNCCRKYYTTQIQVQKF
jgi:hypothetical protein